MQHADAMTLDQKRDFYRDGYVILKNVVPQDMVDAAHSRIESRKEGENLAKAQAMTELVNATAVTPILNETMGRFDPPIAAQVGVIPVSNPGKHFNSLRYRDQDMPYYGAQTHWTATSSSGLPAAGVHRTVLAVRIHDRVSSPLLPSWPHCPIHISRTGAAATDHIVSHALDWAVCPFALGGTVRATLPVAAAAVSPGGSQLRVPRLPDRLENIYARIGLDRFARGTTRLADRTIDAQVASETTV